jgi:hypothetical protein
MPRLSLSQSWRACLVSLGATLAACAVPGQVPASKPHAVVRVAIHHHGKPKARFVEDTLVFDGYRVDLTDSTKPVALRLAPGKHELALASNALEFRAAVEQVQVGYSCVSANCVATVPVFDERMELTPSPANPSCYRAFPIEVRGGDTIDLELEVDSEGDCL